MVSGIYSSQRTIAELVEVVYTADLIHRGLLDLSDRSDFQVRIVTRWCLLFSDTYLMEFLDAQPPFIPCMRLSAIELLNVKGGLMNCICLPAQYLDDA